MLVNDERTRTFLAVSAAAGAAGGGGGGGIEGAQAATLHQQQRQQQRGSPTPPPDPLLRAIDAASNAFQRHGLPRFYAAPRPHASVAWLLGDQAAALQAAVSSPAARGMAARLVAARWQLPVSRVLCRTGQHVHIVWEARR